MIDYSKALILVWQIAASEAFEARHQFIEKEHLFIGFCKMPDLPLGRIFQQIGESRDLEPHIKKEMAPLGKAFVSLKIDPAFLRRRLRSLIGKGGYPHKEGKIAHRSTACKVIFKRAEKLAQERASSLTLTCLMTAILENPGPHIRQALKDAGTEVQALKENLERPQTSEDERHYAKTKPLPAPKETPNLDKFGRDITAQARQGLLPPLIGRRDELLDLIRVLHRTRKNNPVLIGEAGVGKTVIVEGLAQRMASGNIDSDKLGGNRLIEINLSSLVAGTRYRGEFEERLEGIIKEVKRSPDVVLFIDEIHTMVGAGDAEGALDAANILKPYLAKGELCCIGATTIDEYRKRIETDAALSRRFQPVFVEEPSAEETLEILVGIKPWLEDAHEVSIERDALEAAIKLSVRYMIDRRLPDKAIDLLEDACLQEKVPQLSHADKPSGSSIPEITGQHIVHVVSKRTGIPLERLSRGEKDTMLRIDELLKQRIIGQDEAVGKIAQSIKKTAAGLSDPRKPLGVFLFVGPTGVGKTAMAKALAQILFDSEGSLIRLDMSEYTEKHGVSRLIGAPPGYIGYGEEGQLTGSLRTRPYSVVLLDEIEKAHAEVLNLFLPLFDEGRITDAKGRRVDGRSSIFIMTSNVGKEIYLKPPLGFQNIEGNDRHTMGKAVLKEVQRILPLEFINRMEVVFFRPLTMNDLVTIAYGFLENVRERIQPGGVSFEIEEQAVRFICQKGYNELYGARYLYRAIEDTVVNPISEKLLTGELCTGKSLIIALKDGELDFRLSDEVEPEDSDATKELEKEKKLIEKTET